MIIKGLNQCEPFLAGDATHLRELLHPDKADLKINYSLAHAVVKPGQTSLSHRLRTSEVYYILEGKGIMCINDEHALVKPGQFRQYLFQPVQIGRLSSFQIKHETAVISLEPAIIA